MSLEVAEIQDLPPPCNENPEAHISATSTLIGFNFSGNCAHQPIQKWRECLAY